MWITVKWMNPFASVKGDVLYVGLFGVFVGQALISQLHVALTRCLGAGGYGVDMSIVSGVRVGTRFLMLRGA